MWFISVKGLINSLCNCLPRSYFLYSCYKSIKGYTNGLLTRTFQRGAMGHNPTTISHRHRWFPRFRDLFVLDRHKHIQESYIYGWQDSLVTSYSISISFFFFTTFSLVCSQRLENSLKCNLLFGLISHFGLLKDVDVSFCWGEPNSYFLSLSNDMPTFWVRFYNPHWDSKFYACLDQDQPFSGLEDDIADLKAKWEVDMVPPEHLWRSWGSK